MRIRSTCPIACLSADLLASLVRPAFAVSKGVYPKLEISFELPDVPGNPFDYTQVDVRTAIDGPDGKETRLPAFFDGGRTWRVRCAPDEPGRYRLASITVNGKAAEPLALARRAFDVSGPQRPGFIRRDPADPARFIFGDGEPYYPIGNNAAWRSGSAPDIAALFARMGAAGENWSRVWMCHWDGKNLDWVPGRAIPRGTLDLEVARHWDAIVDAAEKRGIYFQMTLQHHGQYSSRVNPNWDENPRNRKNGGFLDAPEDFFTDPQAIALTKAKYRYIIARWGYSANIMAWELFNEVEWTDAIRLHREASVAAWHREMAAFLRAQDPYHHLVTTSSDRRIAGLYDAMDYLQPHAYPSDPVPIVSSIRARDLDRPLFFGEIGPSGDLSRDDGRFLRRALWGGLMSECGGAAQYWSWDVIDRRDLYPLFRSAVGFARRSGMLARHGLTARSIAVETARIGPLSFSPGAGWGTARQTEYTVAPSGDVPGLGGMPAYLQGRAHREMFPRLTLNVRYAVPGTFAVQIGQVAHAGAHVAISVDGRPAIERNFSTSDRDRNAGVTLEARIPAGEHRITLENSGADWAVLERLTLDPYAPALSALGKGNGDYAVLWVAPRPEHPANEGTSAPTDLAPPQPQVASQEEPGAGAKGKLTIDGFRRGSYRIIWWDIPAGHVLSEETGSASSNGRLTIQTPDLRSDAAACITRIEGKGR